MDTKVKVIVKHYRYIRQFCSSCYADKKPLLVRFHRHYRNEEEKDGDGLTVLTKGGMTEVLIVDEKGDELAYGAAWCSKEDNFCYKTGRLVALKRALNNFYDVNGHALSGYSSDYDMTGKF